MPQTFDRLQRDDISEIADNESIQPSLISSKLSRPDECLKLEANIHQRVYGLSEATIQAYATTQNEAIKGHIRTLETEITATLQNPGSTSSEKDHRIGQQIYAQMVRCMEDPIVEQIINCDLVTELTDMASAVQLDIITLETQLVEAQSLKDLHIQEPSQVFHQTQIKMAVNKYKTDVIRPRVNQALQKKRKNRGCNQTV